MTIVKIIATDGSFSCVALAGALVTMTANNLAELAGWPLGMVMFWAKKNGVKAEVLNVEV